MTADPAPTAPRRRKLRRLPRSDRTPRRAFLWGGVVAFGAGLALWVRRVFGPSARLIDARVFIEPGTWPVRPPGAVDDELAFQAACVHCGLCGEVCDNGCIRFFGLDAADHGPLTPYLDVRRRSCTLCMKCTNVCPSGALRAIPREAEAIKQHVRMGVAEVDPELCISYLGRACGYCHDACPLPQHAIKLIPPATPVVIVEGCVGCGRCVELCPQTPTAISVVRRPA